jgi:hypothetical protein
MNRVMVPSLSPAETRREGTPAPSFVKTQEFEPGSDDYIIDAENLRQA